MASYTSRVTPGAPETLASPTARARVPQTIVCGGRRRADRQRIVAAPGLSRVSRFSAESPKVINTGSCVEGWIPSLRQALPADKLGTRRATGAATPSIVSNYRLHRVSVDWPRSVNSDFFLGK